MSSDYLAITEPHHIATPPLHAYQAVQAAPAGALENNTEIAAAQLNQTLAAGSVDAAPAAAAQASAAAAGVPAESRPKSAQELAKEAELLEYLDETPDSLAAHAEINLGLGHGPAFNNPNPDHPSADNPALATSNTGPETSGAMPPAPPPTPSPTGQPSAQELKEAYLEAQLADEAALFDASDITGSSGSTASSVASEEAEIMRSEMEAAGSEGQDNPAPTYHHINVEA